MPEEDAIDKRVAEVLSIGGAFEEALGWFEGAAWDDQYEREMLRQQFIQNRLLAQIAANTGRVPEITTGEIVVDPDGDDDVDQREDPNYWVTEESITVTNTSSFNSESWGFNADTVVLFFDDDTTFSFLPPGDKPNRELTLEADDYSPFSISGVDGLFASRVWYQQADSATSTPSLDIIAVE